MTHELTGRPGFDRKMTAEEILHLPLRQYDGPILVVNDTKELPRALEIIKGESILGFDTETRPAYRKGESYPPALLQLCGGKGACIFQVQQVGLPAGILDILSRPDIIKAGIALWRDVDELAEQTHFKPAGFVDIAALSSANNMKNHGLRGLAAVLLGFRISKKAQRSNWARRQLTPDQVHYAATDAWVGRELYIAMQLRGFV